MAQFQVAPIGRLNWGAATNFVNGFKAHNHITATLLTVNTLGKLY